MEEQLEDSKSNNQVFTSALEQLKDSQANVNYANRAIKEEMDQNRNMFKEREEIWAKEIQLINQMIQKNM